MAQLKPFDKQSTQDVLALTSMQEGMLYHYLQDPANDLYFEQLALEISGIIDVKIFEKAWNLVIEINDGLRTVFRWEKLKHPLQVVLKKFHLNPIFHDVSNKKTSDKNILVEEIKKADRKKKFDLKQVPFRVTLCKIDENRYHMIISNHHILYDGWSNGIILKEFFHIYNDLAHKRVPVKPVKTKFKEYIKWINTRDKKKQEKFWRSYLQGFEEPAELAIKNKTTGKKTINCPGNYHMRLSQQIKDRVEEYIKRNKITLATLLYSAWGICLQKYNNCDDVLFGTTISGRSAKLKGMENIVGLLINTLPLRVRKNPHELIIDMLKQVNRTLQVREEYESASLVDIKGYSGSGNEGELFDTLLAIENYPLERRLILENSKLCVDSYSMVELTNYDLAVSIVVFDHIDVEFVYNRGCISADVIKRLSAHFSRVIENILMNPGQEADKIDILSGEEKQQLLVDFNSTAREYSSDKTIHELFTGQVERIPDYIALEGRGEFANVPGLMSVTYSELNNKSGRLAVELTDRGVKADTIVGIMLPRSLEMVIGTLAILKAGGAYLPIDPEYPRERINFVLEDSGAKLLVTAGILIKEVKKLRSLEVKKDLEIIFIDSIDIDFSVFSSSHLLNFSTSHSFHSAHSANLAYVIYTSGSTGRPKGVIVEHTSAVNLLQGLQREYPVKKSDAYLMKTSVVFDVSVTELFGWFLGPGRLIILEKGGEKDPDQILSTIERAGITHINFVPSMFNAFIETLNSRTSKRLSGLKYIFLAGETLLPGVVNKFKQLGTGIRLENIYGPTEGTVYSSKFSLDSWDGRGSIPIGEPMVNTRLYILDKTNHLQPIGVPGELSISGVGVARGYLNRVQLTSEQFNSKTNKKFLRGFQMFHGRLFQKEPPGRRRQKTYKTGDLACWLPDGNIYFLGRIDLQVKIRGFRIETAEIESRIAGYGGINETVVTARQDRDGERYLCAYIVADKSIEITGLKKYLAGKLPEYMIPSYYVRLDSLRLTPTGKIDRKSLPEPEIRSNREYIAPGNEIEAALVNIWSEVLGIDDRSIGIEDNFFELGGHSLKVTRLVSRIHREFDIEVPLAQLFKTPTVRGLYRFIKEANQRIHRSIEAAEEKEYYPLSPVQKRLYFLQQTDLSSISYNIPYVFIIETKPDRSRIQSVFRKLIQRYESFRTSFKMIEDEPVQQVGKQVEIGIEYRDTRERGTDVRSGWKEETGSLDISSIIHGFVRPFDLSRAPLLRVALIKFGEERNFLIVDMHHIIADGTSMAILIDEFPVLYTDTGTQLTGLKLQYRDYAGWRHKGRDDHTTKQQEAYWLNQFKQEIPVLALPTDYSRPVMQSFAGNTIGFTLDKHTLHLLKTLALEENTSLFMVLLAIFNILLVKVCGQEEIVVGIGTEGRRHQDLSRIVGMFVNTLALRNPIHQDSSFKHFLGELTQRSLEAFENQEYPFEDLVEKLAVQRDTGRNPLFDVMFQFNHLDINGIDIPGLKLNAYPFERGVSKFDLTLWANEGPEGLLFAFEYCTDLFKQETIEIFIRYFREVAFSVVTGPARTKTLYEIRQITPESKQQILSRINQNTEQEVNDIIERGQILQTRLNESFRRYENKIAVEYGPFAITYNELDKRSNHVANRILGRGFAKGTAVGVLMEDRVALIIAAVGILKAGCAFVPLDPAFPRQRQEIMMDAADIKFILADRLNFNAFNSDNFPGHRKGDVELVLIDRWFADLETAPVIQPSHIRYQPGDRVYIYFTSGSTGIPKAIAGQNISLMHFLHWEIDTFVGEDKYRFSQLITPGFDAFLRDVFVPLCIGGVICIPGTKEVLSVPEPLLDWLEYSRVHLVCCVPGLFRILTANRLNRDRLPELKTIFLSGERITAHDLEKWFQVFDERIALVNLWGTSETTMAKTFHLIGKTDLNRQRIPVGKAMRGSTVMVLDEYMELCDPVVTGELYIRTPFRSSGYYNDPQLNRERFIQNPFNNDPDDLLHKTGDLGRILADGTIDLLGRNDRQVKIRGIRIELEEIESVLLKHPRIHEAVVLKNETSDHSEFLCAYVVEKHVVEKKSDGAANDRLSEKLNEFLLERLPTYMIPNSVRQLDSLPRLPNGKIDYKALQAYEEKKQKQEYIAPQNHIQEKLIELWTEILNIEPIGTSDNFFALGGNSLKVMTLISRIHKDFDLRIPLGDIFNNPTVEKQALILEGQKKEMYASLESLEKREHYPLSSAQKRLYVLQQLDMESIAYNMSQAYVFLTEPDRKKLELAFKKAIERHESFRTSFRVIGDEIVQRIDDHVDFEMEYYNCRLKDAYRQFIRPFILSRAPLLRVGIVKLPMEERIAESISGNTTHLLIVDMHHIISDGVSTGILIEEFAAYYADVSPPGLRLQYRDYSGWQNKSSQDKGRKQQEQYWLKQFEGEIPVLNIPIDFARPMSQSFAGDALHFEISEDETHSLKSLALKEEVTLFMVLLSITNVLLSLLGSQEDVIIGAPTAARQHADLQRIIGMFVNTMALRNKPCGNKTFRQFLHEVKKSTLEAYENQEFPFEELVEKLSLPGDTSRNPLFDTIFVLQNMEIPHIGIPGLKLKPFEYKTGISKFDLAFNSVEEGGKLLFTVEYCTGLFKEETILRINRCFLNIVSAITKNPGKRISGISIIPEEEKQRILHEFNDTGLEYPRDKTILRLFADLVKRNPDNTAVIGMVRGIGDTGGAWAQSIAAVPGKHYGHITYHELNQRSSRLAGLLMEKGVSSGITAAIMVERSLEMVIGLLGILKAGGAYLPLDPGWPGKRLQYILNDSSAKILVTTGSLDNQLKKQPECIFIDSPEDFNISSSYLLNFSTSRPSGLAYVIYTSGTTGRPKGVLVNHMGLLNMVYAYREVFTEDSDSRISQVANPAFDAMASEIWPCLSMGATLYIVDDETRLSPVKMKQWLIEKEITNSFQPTVMAEHLLEQEWPREGAALKTLRTAGDRLTRYPAIHYPFTLYNLYGPTEDTVWTAWTEVKPDPDPIGYPSIGKPVKNHRIYIFSQNMQLQPIGIPGELSIAGDGLARGYLNQPELTAEKFIIATKTQRHKDVYFSWCPGVLEAKLYRTGDLACWLSNGDIDFLGRIDNQVKIRGFRIEIEEIEKLLLNREEIKETVVVAREDKNGEKYLSAYIVSQEEPDITGWRNYLSGALPDYMIPTYFVRLDAIPLTPNGKTDKRALPEPDTEAGIAYVPPGTILEEKLTVIWAEVLGRERESRIGIHDNFFELGGHSLKATTLISKIQKELNFTIPLVEIFTNPTIAGLANFLKKSFKREYVPIKPVEKKEYYRLSSTQKRLYILRQRDLSSTGYNIPQAILIEGVLDSKRVQTVFRKLIERHESLRTSFEIPVSEPVQRIHEKVNFEIEYYSFIEKRGGGKYKLQFTNKKESGGNGLSHIFHQFIRGFDLSRAPLLRVGLIELPPGFSAASSHPGAGVPAAHEKGGHRYIMMVDMHHIIADGTSMAILIKEFSALAGNIRTQLPGCLLQYKDYTEWQNNEERQKTLKRQEAYWLNRLTHNIPVLKLPIDQARTGKQHFQGDTLNFSLGEKTGQQLRALAFQEGASLFMILLALFNGLLAKLSGQDDIIVGTGIEGRRHEDLRKIVGMFVNTLVLRNAPRGDMTFIDFLAEVKQVTLKAFENQEYPFENLVEALPLAAGTNRNPLFDVLFQFNNLDLPEIRVPGLKLTPYRLKEQSSKFDLTFWIDDDPPGLEFSLKYKTTLFKRETIAQFAGYFKEIVTRVLVNPHKKLGEILQIPGERKQEILVKLNRGIEAEINQMSKRSQVLLPRLKEISRKCEQQTAVEYGDILLTYGELAKRAGCVNRQIKLKGIQKQTLIGILAADRAKLICTILGILEAGCVFVPLDPAHPQARLQMMVKSLGMRVICSDTATLDSYAVGNMLHDQGTGAEIIRIDEAFTLIDAGESQPTLPRDFSYQPEDSIYVYFTSGTTGTPKGILGKNIGLMHFIQWEIDTFEIDGSFRFSQLINPGFDAFLRDVFVPLCSGGVICIPQNHDIPPEGEYLVNWLERSRVHLVHCVPGLFRVISTQTLNREALPELKAILLSGERITPSDLEKWFTVFGERIKYVNLWGPTETTLVKTFHIIGKSDLNRERIPVGQPMRGAAVMVLDEYSEICGPLVIGELYIRTPFRTPGYANDIQLNRRKFIQNPFSCDPQDLLYRTGDLGRLLLDGTIDLLGRNDRQVKIRGVRIEPEEIEHVLLKHPRVKEAVVLKKVLSPSNEILAAYITEEKGKEPIDRDSSDPHPLAQQLKKYLTENLPNYMVPARITKIEKMPGLPNRKIDYNALHELEVEKRKYIAPRDDFQKLLVRLWSRLLKKEQISIKDNFFILGGHSLNMMTLVSWIRRNFSVMIPFEDIFNNPTIEQQAVLIAEARKKEHHTIEPVEKKEYYKASSVQKRLYFLQQIDANNTAYNMPQVLLTEGKPDRKKLERASRQTIRRHESFKTSFEMLNNEVVQRIHNEVEFELDYFDLTADETTYTSHDNLLYFIRRSFLRPFDISRPPLLRIGLARLEKKKYLLMTDMHHIISDGVSMTILIKEFTHMYTGTALPGLRLQYKDYAEWQHIQKDRQEIKQQEKYWLGQFEGELPILNLPLDFPPLPGQDFAGDYTGFEIDAEQTAALKSLALTEKVTLFMLLLSIHNVWLSKLCGQEEIIVGIPTAGRPHAHLRDIIGMFVNTLALRSQIFSDCSFKKYLENIKTKTLNAYENQEYDLEDLVSTLQINRDASRNPLFDVTFLLQNLDFEELNIPGMKLEHLEFKNKISKFVLSLQAVETGETLHFILEYSTKRLKKETVHLFANYFKQVLNHVLQDPGQNISQIELIPAEEKIQVLYAFNETGLEYPREQTLYDLFTIKVEAIPDHIALTEVRTKSRGTGRLNLPVDHISITYRELNRQSTQLSRLLREKGVTSDTIAGIMMERSAEMIIGISGIIKAGGAYLPIDPDYPEERKQYMLMDSGAKVLITTSTWIKEVKKLRSLEVKENFEFIFIDSLALTDLSSSYLLNFSTSAPQNLAYIIYTSGSTGKPKGVPVEHLGVVRLVTQANYIDYMALNEDDRLLLTGNFVFDITTFEIWAPLLQGINLYLAGKDMIMDAGALQEIVLKNRISIMHLIPQLFNQHVFSCPEIFEKLRCFLVGGDMVSPGAVFHLQNKYSHLKILHMYGPTENTTFSTFFPVEKSEKKYRERIPIGKPISNSTVYILNSHNQFQPPGLFGELCTGGDGLVRGYLNNPELTAEKFVSFPGPRGKKIYKTGDLGRWLPDGNIEFMGRIDHQVKIRGFRIEIEEIENQLSAHPRIKESVVAAREDEKQEKYLCAYFVPVSNTNFPAAVLRDYLAQTLPDYMIPSYFVSLEKIPLTSNGKVDRRALPAPGFKTGEGYKAPKDHIEEKLSHIWSEVLGGREHTAIGTNDNFFELGGHSLKATIMAAKIHREFNVRVPLPSIFLNPTIARLAKTIKEAAADKYAAIQATEEKEYYELSSGQKRLFIIQQMEPAITGYHISGAFELEGTPDIFGLEKTFGQLVRRHGSFRTSFQLKGTVPVQRVRHNVEFKIENLQLENTDPRPIISKKETGIQNSFIRPFDLSRAPLLRVGLLKINEHRHILIVDMHHIVSDGSSMAVLIENFMTLYKGEELPRLRIRYADYSQWHNNEKNSGSINRQEAYWSNHLAGEIPVLNLPLDYPRPPVQNFEGNTVKFEMDEEDTGALKSLALKEEVTLFMLLLAIINILLSKLSGQEEIIVGMPVAARRHADLQEIIGMFVNTLLLWNKPVGEKTFDRFLKEVKATTLNAYENQEYPFEDLVEKVALRRDASRNPLFDVIFALQNMENREIEIPGLTLKPYEYENKTSKFDLTIMAVETENKLVFTIEYCIKLFKHETILGFITYLKNLVSSISRNQENKISRLSFLPAEEKQRLLYEFNDTDSENSSEKTLHELFREQAEQVPDHIALIGKLTLREDSYSLGEGNLTYRQLNQQSEQLACLLREKGVRSDTIVGIMLERSIAMIVCIMGILKAGGAYLPIDPDHPGERTDYMLKDSRARVLITSGPPETVLNLSSFQLLNFSSSQLLAFPSSQVLSITTSCPSNLAYIIYTSGTTGQPKGNLTTHANVLRVVKNTNYIDLTGTDRILQLSNYAFDGSVFDIYGALVNGSVLVMVERETVMATDQLALLIKRQHITVFFVTTALFNTLIEMQMDCFAHVRKVLFGGERVSLEYSRRALEYMGKGKVIHVYGPTETTVYATYYFIDHILADSVTIPIGKPITHTSAYILDKYYELVPIGITGELYIGGQGLARGYLNQPELTAKKFETGHNKKFLRGFQMFHGQFLQKAPPGRRRQTLYKTGDLVNRQGDGNIEFIGRIDSQIKIRGFRVELGEIEARLLNHGQIKEAVVITRELGEGNRQLVAYIVNRSGGGASSQELQEYLSGFLPDFMIPSYIIELEKLPLTPNGKVDKKMLPRPGLFKSSNRENFAAPATDMEKRIADAWKEVLKLEEVGIDDNFFDIGGNSLNILQVNQKLNTFFSVPLPVIIMFRYTTIRSLSGYLSEQETDDTLDRKKRSQELQQGKSDRLKRYRKREQRNRKVEIKEKEK